MNNANNAAASAPASRWEILDILDMLRRELAKPIAGGTLDYVRAEIATYEARLAQTHGHVVAVKRAEFTTFTGRRMVAVLISTGKVELYRVENDGLEMFEGYITSALDSLWVCYVSAALDAAPLFPGVGRSVRPAVY